MHVRFREVWIESNRLVELARSATPVLLLGIKRAKRVMQRGIVGRGSDCVLRSVVNLTSADSAEEGLVREFWLRVEDFAGVLVSFNGRGFDLPVLELAALRYGISAPRYFAEADSPRLRHRGRHLDLYDFLGNFGAAGLRGGMDMLLKMIGMPGKIGMDGAQVQDYFEAGRLDEIRTYCRADVIRTYLLFLRVELLRGRIDSHTYHTAVAASAAFVAELDAAGVAHRAG